MNDLLTGFQTILAGEYPRLLLSGLGLTLAVSLCALLVSVVVGMALGIVRVFRVPLLAAAGATPMWKWCAPFR